MTNAEFALPRGYALREYRIESTLGSGGFGLTYLATDGNLDLKVAIKEYLPRDFAVRGADDSVKPRSEATVDRFNWGRARFLEEGRMLASFRHPGIVRVLRFFEGNGTAYMVMEFIAGKPLDEWMEHRWPLSQAELHAILMPLLEGLGVVHHAGILHRDIKPGNIYIRDDGAPVLLDFGSARLAGADTERTALVSPGYAPPEQYHSRGNQGPWTDIYAIGAVLYWIVTGAKPASAPARIPTDTMQPAVAAGNPSRYGPALLKTIDWALAPAEETRPQSVLEFSRALQRAAASDRTTVYVERTQRSDADLPRPGGPPAGTIDGDTLQAIIVALAHHIGPIASTVVQSAAREPTAVPQLVDKVATEIADAKARAAFVKQFAADRTRPATISTPPAPAASGGQPAARPGMDPAVLAQAEAELANHVGALARFVVRNAAAKARNEQELYSLLANEIDDPAEKQSFLKRLASAGRRA